MRNDLQRAATEGISDAIGFISGALIGYGIGYLLGLDIFSQGYDTRSVLGIALVGIGGGMGLSLARRWRRRKN
ncbi:hypothetical protein [Diaphorobacter aerolatus]|uniref:Uncharacterized protein n=1 Tax=Diaphorobacter aerolatus TaxID=1288495 RepID=A0A7H0GHP5_9BURK|nr:hypothetical protein [Diaphorobacter aerolatus]QNP47811.1 hypothetical protein H9K75_16860 [Diaphorobacter aerolatus]